MLPKEHKPGSRGLFTVTQASKYLACSRNRIFELINGGALAAVRDGNLVKIHVAELERYIGDLPAYEPAAAS